MNDETSIVSDVRFEKLVYGGDALARVNGQVLLVPFALPGETATVETAPAGRSLLRGRLAGITDRSTERVEAECKYFTRCGGCHYQHARYEYQLSQKLEILRESIRRTGKFEPPEEIDVVAGPPFQYRNRVQLHVDWPKLGYHEAGSHDLVDIDACPISSPRIGEAIDALRGMMRDRRWPRFLRSLELFTNEREVQVNVLHSGDRHLSRSFFEWCAEKIPGATAPALEYEAAGHTFRVSHKSFFQVNRFLIDRLVETALRGSEGGHALDLYAGVGLFSLALAQRFSKVAAVESGSSAVADLLHNARQAGVTVEAVRQSAEVYLAAATERPDFVLADPPRAGLGQAAVKEILRLSPPRLTIVSCDPSTLARDLAALTQSAYQIESLTLVDLFPQTCHIESVAALTAR